MFAKEAKPTAVRYSEDGFLSFPGVASANSSPTVMQRGSPGSWLLRWAPIVRVEDPPPLGIAPREPASTWVSRPPSGWRQPWSAGHGASWLLGEGSIAAFK